jgi:CBS domain-containing protein
LGADCRVKNKFTPGAHSGEPLGVVTKTDLLRAYAIDKVSSDAEVQVTMSGNVFTVKGTDNRDAVAKALIDRKVHHAVVVDDAGKMIGITSSYDIANEVALDAKAHPWSREALVEWE